MVVCIKGLGWKDGPEATSINGRSHFLHAVQARPLISPSPAAHTTDSAPFQPTKKNGTPVSSRGLFGLLRGRQVILIDLNAAPPSLFPFSPLKISFHLCMIYTEDHEAVDELYDENADEEDEKWVNKHWRRGKALPTQQGNAAAAPSTDAVLNCPCCFTTVCMDCQR